MVADESQAVNDQSHEKRTISKGVLFASIAVTLLVGFVAGTRSNDIYAAIGPLFGIKVASGSIDLTAVNKTYSELAANFDGQLDTQKLIDGASRGLVAAAGDKYTVFMDAEEAKEFDNDLSGDIGGGIGAEIGVRHDQPTILRVLTDNPAEKAGIKQGDTVISINDESSIGWTAEKTAGKIRGDIGTSVKVGVLRQDKPLEFTITRQSVTSPSVYSKIQDNIGILTISRFDGKTSELTRRAAEDFKQAGVKGVIVDLRNNGGGFLTPAQDIAGIWLNDKVVVTERTNGKVVDELKSDTDTVLAGVPTVVIVNGGSASASEIVAGALQDHGVAKLIGEKTFGKGTVQKMIELGAGTRLKVTMARWYTPKGNNITEQGIAPDQEVKLTDEQANSGQDPQMDAAKAYLMK